MASLNQDFHWTEGYQLVIRIVNSVVKCLHDKPGFSLDGGLPIGHQNCKQKLCRGLWPTLCKIWRQLATFSATSGWNIKLGEHWWRWWPPSKLQCNLPPANVQVVHVLLLPMSVGHYWSTSSPALWWENHHRNPSILRHRSCCNVTKLWIIGYDDVQITNLNFTSVAHTNTREEETS